MATTTRAGVATDPLSPEHRKTLRDLHQRFTVGTVGAGGREACLGCRQDWPCDVTALLGALEAEETKVQAVADLGVRLRWDRTVNKTAHVVRLMLECIGIDHREEMKAALRPPSTHATRSIGDPTAGSGF